MKIDRADTVTDTDHCPCRKGTACRTCSGKRCGVLRIQIDSTSLTLTTVHAARELPAGIAGNSCRLQGVQIDGTSLTLTTACRVAWTGVNSCDYR